MRSLKLLIVFAVTSLLAAPSHAAPVWSEELSSWKLVLNDGVAYVASSLLPAECMPSRAIIRMSGAEYDKALFDFALARYPSSIRVFVDTSGTECVVLGIQS